MTLMCLVGKIYAMKTLRKSEMFKKDQVRNDASISALDADGCATVSDSWLTLEQKETCWQNPTLLGSSSYTIPSKIRNTFTCSWSSYLEEIS